MKRYKKKLKKIKLKNMIYYKSKSKTNKTFIKKIKEKNK